MAGHQGNRYELLSKLISDAPDLVKIPNSRGENILLFLVQTVGRQQIEQRQPRPTSRSRKSASSRKSTSAADNNDPDMPEHDLEPPKFARKALEKLLYDWNTVKAMIMTGHKEPSPSQVMNFGNFLNKFLTASIQCGSVLRVGLLLLFYWINFLVESSNA